MVDQDEVGQGQMIYIYKVREFNDGRTFDVEADTEHSAALKFAKGCLSDIKV